MLKNLYIHNYAIIEEISIDFSPRLNVITGETGAGKSILMGALSLILGERADTSVLLNRAKKCVVEGTFTTENRKRLLALLRENDIEAEEDSPEIVIRREIGANGKSRAFVNDIPVNLELLRQVSTLLVDLHRQFDTLSLSDSRFQLDVVDSLAGSSDLLQSYSEAFLKWKHSTDELNSLNERKNSFNKEYDYQKFLFDELDEAGFVDNELEDADAELKVLGNSEAIKSALDGAGSSLSGGDQPLVHQLKSIQHQLESFAKYHHALNDIVGRLHSAQIEVKDIAEEISRVNDEVVYDPARIEKLNERISIGYKLLKKHGVQTTAQLLDIQRQLDEKLKQVLSIDDQLVAKQKEVDSSFATMSELATRLSEKRHRQIKPLQDKVNALLAQVGMPNAKVKVEIAPGSFDVAGKDDVEFLFDANKSNRFEPVRKVASGGELSRLMLSIKSLVAESMDLPTLIFDEIDTGISGEAARQVGVIMHALARSRQLITITHQPQIAGKADAHLFVYKEIVNDKVRTAIRQMTGDERITAIAKMLSGERPTAAALENAKEMMN
ncbi:MAG: DNA repair protein RecN [Chitinophagaceae bacterium]|nr:DNA repair protein RecN [Chitinophagaceae bacterium]